MGCRNKMNNLSIHQYFLLLVFFCNSLYAQPINRQALVERHIVVNERVDALSSLSVGNGSFAFTVDVTGLQSFPEDYAPGVPLGTESEWGWHSFVDTAGYRFSETLQSYKFNGRMVPYAVQLKEPQRKVNAVNWFRQNPHRLQLGSLGFDIILKNGQHATLKNISHIHQTLNPWTGEIHSLFTVENVPVEVFTYCHQQTDIIAVKVISKLLQQKRLHIRLQFPYPTGEFKDAGINRKEEDRHYSVLTKEKNGGLIRRQLDGAGYFVAFQWRQTASVQQKQKHLFLVNPSAKDSFEMVCQFSQTLSKKVLPSFNQTAVNSRQEWKIFWESGAAVDFSGSTDQRAFELERRIVLSEYLTKIQCAGNYPPQETGLTYNSWYGKPHLEMHWWHAIHFAFWGRAALLEKSLSWYRTAYKGAKTIAERQGYKGVRWQKMTDPAGGESPSSVGAFLIWQQPHLIYFSELVYRAKKDIATLEKYKDLVFATADFMADYAFYEASKNRYILGKGVIPAQERFKPEDTFNPAYELVYWHWALTTAQEWRKRLHLPVNKKWEDVLKRLSGLTVQDDKYLFTENATDSYTNPVYRGDHPSVLGALGLLPLSAMTDTAIMHHTFNWIWKEWRWPDTWGWDYPMVAMTATRLGLPDTAIDALLMPVQKNTYLNNGHNYQDGRLTIYLPGNGGLLAAVALMCGGYDGDNHPMPGIPQHKGWKVRCEGFAKMP